ncbi:hypothetical protein [Deinococcus sp. PEB2-67]
MTKLEELLAQQEALLNESLNMAKAAQSDDGSSADLDDDFTDLDAARNESETANDEQEQDTETEDAGTQDATETQDAPGQDNLDDDEGATGTMAKAAGYVDGGPLLQQISAHLTSIHEQLGDLRTDNAALRQDNVTLRRQNVQLAKAVQAQSQGLLTMSKAQQAALGLPTLPPSRQARAQRDVKVPIAVDAPSATQAAQSNGARAQKIMAKAQQAVTEGRLNSLHISYYNELFRTMPVDEALQQLHPDERALLTGN